MTLTSAALPARQNASDIRCCDMAIIALKQRVNIVRTTVDEWGEPVGVPEGFTLKCSVKEGAKLVRKTSSTGGTSIISAEEVVSSAQITFDKFTDIRHTDEIYYTDESGATRLYLPLNIERVRLNGKALLTKVNV